jgi:hypothetical protein
VKDWMSQESEDNNKEKDTDDVAINFEEAKEEESVETPAATQPGETPAAADNVDNLLPMMATLNTPKDEKKKARRSWTSSNESSRSLMDRLMDMENSTCVVILVVFLVIVAVVIILSYSIKKVPENELGLKYKKYSRVRVPIPVLDMSER